MGLADLILIGDTYRSSAFCVCYNTLWNHIIVFIEATVSPLVQPLWQANCLPKAGKLPAKLPAVRAVKGDCEILYFHGRQGYISTYVFTLVTTCGWQCTFHSEVAFETDRLAWNWPPSGATENLSITHTNKYVKCWYHEFSHQNYKYEMSCDFHNKRWQYCIEISNAGRQWIINNIKFLKFVAIY